MLLFIIIVRIFYIAFYKSSLIEMYTSNIHVEVVSGFHRNCIKKIHRSNDEFSSIKIRLKKVNYVEFRPWKLCQKKYVEIMLTFHPSKLDRTKYMVTTSIFTHRNYVEESTLKRYRFFSHQNNIEKLGRNDMEIGRYFLFDAWVQYRHRVNVNLMLHVR